MKIQILQILFVISIGCNFIFAQKPVSSDAPELLLSNGHTIEIETIGFSPNGQYLVTGGADQTVKIRDIETGIDLRTFTAHKNIVVGVRWSRDGKNIISVDADGAVYIWDAASGEIHRQFRVAEKEFVSSVAFSDDERRIITADSDKTAKVWDLTNGKMISIFKNHTDKVETAAFAPDNQTAASAGKDKTVKIWNTQTAQELKSFDGHQDKINALIFSRDGRQIISGDEDGTVHIVAIEDGAANVISAGKKGINSLSLNETGEKLAAGGDDRQVVVWNWRDGKPAPSSARHISQISAVAFNPKGDRLASADQNASIKIWETSSMNMFRSFRRFSGPVTSVAFSPDGEWLATGHYDYWIRLRNTKGERETRFLRGHNKAVNALCFSPDGKILVSASADGLIIVWDLIKDTEKFVLNDETGERHRIALSGDGKTLISTGGDKMMRIWNVETGQQIYRADGDSISSPAAINFQGTLVAVSDDIGDVDIYQAQDGSLAKKLKNPDYDLHNNLRFSPDGNFLVADAFDSDRQKCLIYVWDLKNGDESEPFAFEGSAKFELNSYQSLNFSRDGKILAAGDEQGNLDVFNFQNRKFLYSSAAHQGGIDDLSFSADDKFIASAGGIDSSTRILRAADGKLILTLVCPTQSTDFIAVTPEGFFDGTLEDLNRVGWRFDRDAFKFAPLEAYFNEFLRPGVFSEAFKPETRFQPKELKLLDRTQPEVSLETSGKAATETQKNRFAEIKINVKIAARPNGKPRQARDLRLFRNGVLFKHWKGALKLDPANRAVVTTRIPISAGENRLTAYAYNQDNIKSADSPPLVLRGAEELRRKGTLYVISIGLKNYANSDFDLNYAADDAKTIAAALSAQQNEIKRWNAVKTVTILNSDATKNNILAVFGKLTGKNSTLETKSSPALREIFREIQTAEPEDGVLIFFSGHGAATADGRFYLIPYNFVKNDSKPEELNRTSRASAISDLEMADALEEIIAERQALIIDACYAGKFLETGDARRAPINQTGLAQLAFEKGIAVLAAAQGSQKAREDYGLKQGLLTYALLKEGLDHSAADSPPRDGMIEIREWFDYAVRAVPQMPAVLKQECKDIGRDCNLEDAAMQKPQAFFRENNNFESFFIARLPDSQKTYERGGISFKYPAGSNFTETPKPEFTTILINPYGVSSTLELTVLAARAEIDERVLQSVRNVMNGEMNEETSLAEDRGRQVLKSQIVRKIAGQNVEFVVLTIMLDDKPDESDEFGWTVVKNRIVIFKSHRSLRTKNEVNTEWLDNFYQSLKIE